jgi:ribosomal-protein-alanine N-acetyltransferase
MLRETQNLKLLLRTMRREDIPRVQAIDRASFTMPWPDLAFQRELEKTESLCRVAEVIREDNSRLVVGMIITWLIIDEAHIATIAVDPHYRRLGIGRRLLADTLKTCILKGVNRVTLEVREYNETAQALYRSFNFQTTGRRKHYYIDTDEDALIMVVEDLGEKDLAWLTDQLNRGVR